MLVLLLISNRDLGSVTAVLWAGFLICNMCRFGGHVKNYKWPEILPCPSFMDAGGDARFLGQKIKDSPGRCGSVG